MTGRCVRFELVGTCGFDKGDEGADSWTVLCAFVAGAYFRISHPFQHRFRRHVGVGETGGGDGVGGHHERMTARFPHFGQSTHSMPSGPPP